MRAFALVVALGVAGCHRGSKLESFRDALVRGDLDSTATITAQAPACAHHVSGDDESIPCLQELVRALGSDGTFSATTPDDASLGAAAVYFLPGGRRLPDADEWLAAIAGGSGPGADALRLAVASRMAEAASVVRKDARDEAHARAFVDTVARAVPGGVRDWPGPRALGLALSAAMARWTAASHALDLGQDRMTGQPRLVLGEKMGIVRVATGEIEARGGKEPQPP